MLKSHRIPIRLITLDQDSGYHLLISIKMGKKKYWAVLDTGASRTVFDIQSLENEGFTAEAGEKSFNAATLFTTINTEERIIPHFRIGSLDVYNFMSIGLDLSSVNNAYMGMGHPQIIGIIGSDILKQHHAIINYAREVLILKA